MKELSVVITVLNEEENVSELIRQLHEALKEFDYEVIFVDDGSTDSTRQKIKENANPHIRMVELRKNYGQSTAMSAGIDYAVGKYVALLDGDLQNDPSDIPMMLEVLKKGDWDVVAGNRKNRKDGAFLRKIPSKIANWIIRKQTKINIQDYGCTLKVFKSDIAKNLGLYGELHRFIPVLASLQGARITQVDVKHHPRLHGKSKYGIGRTFKVVSDLVWVVFMQKYMQKPMHLFGGIATVFTIIGVLIYLWLLILKILGNDIGGKPLLTVGTVSLIAGLQFFTMGILAELNMRTYYESQNKRRYNVRSEFSGDETQPQA